jgi:hypothetical protein
MCVQKTFSNVCKTMTMNKTCISQFQFSNVTLKYVCVKSKHNNQNANNTFDNKPTNPIRLYFQALN